VQLDCIVFCTPEYNFSLSGGLKNAIDCLSRLSDQPIAAARIASAYARTQPETLRNSGYRHYTKEVPRTKGLR
jgi:NAD(P)H-dependent FMN reductase